MGAYRRRDKKIDESFARVYDLFPILKSRRTQLAGNMSGGEQQMCAMARALMANPRLLVIDEMSLGLAPLIVDHLLAVLKEIRAQGVTVLLVEQDVFAAFSVAEHADNLQTGRVVREGAVADLGRTGFTRGVSGRRCVRSSDAVQSSVPEGNSGLGMSPRLS